MEPTANVDDLLGMVPGPAIHLRGGELVAANRSARTLLDHPDGPLAAVHPADLPRVVSAATSVEAPDGHDTPGPPVLVRLGDGPPHRFAELTFGPHPEGGAVALVHEVTERERLDAAIAEVATGVYFTDADLRATWIPRKVGESVGLPPETFVGRDVYDLLHPDDVAPIRELVARAIEMPGVRCARNLRVHQPDQPDVWWPIVVHIVWRGDDAAIGGLFVRFDMDLATGVDLRGAEETAQGLVTLGSSSLTGALHIDLDGRLRQRSTRVREILRPVGDDADQRWLELLSPPHRAPVAERLEAARAGTLLPATEVCFEGQGALVWARLDVLPYRDTHGQVAGMFVNVLDLTAEHEARDALSAAREELWHLANHDALTGVANRYQLNDRLLAALRETDDGGAPHHRPAVIVCDLDRFKEVNDRHGHRVGDEVLVETARRITAAVGPNDLVCRFGGDEFLVLCQHVTGASELAALVDRVVEGFAVPMEIDHLALDVGISAGGALAEPGDTADPDTLVLRADRAMYAAKARNRPSHAAG